MYPKISIGMNAMSVQIIFIAVFRIVLKFECID
jgi:hypothetical protein